MSNSLLKYIFRVVIFILFCGLSQNSSAQLKANFSAIPISGCTPLIVNFSDASTGNPTSWKWDLGGGTYNVTLQNPTSTYFAPGKYTIRLIVSNANGTDSVVKTQYITVYASPTVDFSGTPLSSCTVPVNTQFTDLSSAGSGSITKWEWDFGDGFLSSVQNPQHTYANAGNYNVTLRITNSLGCFTSVPKPNYVKLSGVKADFSNSNPSQCSAPATINFQNLSTGSGALSYQWFFGDGATSTNLNPVHVYNTAGTYTVKLIVTNSLGCSDTLIKPDAIVIGKGIANFSVPASICRGNAVAILNTSNPPPSSVFWDFGDGTFSTLLNPVKTYNSTGTYSIKLVSRFGACIDSITKTVTVLPELVPNFTADVFGSCKTPLTVNFTSNVPGAVTYFWDFGDGSTSTTVNPSHTYVTNGSFEVTLTVTSAGGCSQILYKPDYIKIQPLTVTIPGLPDKGCAPFTRTFTANVTPQDPIVSYLWNFGDGSPVSILANPSHTFVNPGNYPVSLSVTTSNGCTGTVNYVDAIKTGLKPTANFVGNPRDVCAETQVQFTDLSTGNQDEWLWSFGDGGTAFSRDPKHRYADTGIFSVKLIVWNNGCADSIRFDAYVHIHPPIAIFIDTFNCSSPFKRQFLDKSIGADTWHWDFGDGDTSNLRSPLHTYAAAGAYMVSLTVTNFITGCSYTRLNPVNILGILPDFMADTAVCAGSTVNFKARNIDSTHVISYRWNFGDGNTTIDSTGFVQHIYPVSGKYTVSLIITNTFGCNDTIIKPQYIFVGKPTAGLYSNTNACLNNPIITFNDSTITDGIHPIKQWIWNYGDGIIDSLNSSPFQHRYTSAGVFSISLKVKDTDGCIDSTQKINYITITDAKANFFTNDTLSCPGSLVNFTDISIGQNLSYAWDFGDGVTSTLAKPTHQYTKTGIYSVKLKVINQFGCIDSMVKKSYINIRSPKADFTLSDTLSTCPPLVVKFSNQSTDYTSFTWDFGDGTSSKLDTPTHFYSSTGIFTVKLTASDVRGCQDVKTRQVVIRGPQGSFSYSKLRGCIPYQTDFIAHTSDKISFIWDFNDGTTVKTTDTTIRHTYINAGSYLPKMILVDPNGCQVAITGADSIHALDVTASFKVDRFILCDSGFVNFNNTSKTNDSIASYIWAFGDGGNALIENPTHYYKTPGTYITSLQVITRAGCTDTAYQTVPVKVIQSPLIKIIGDLSACVPSVLTFSGQVVRPDTSAVTWNWNFGNSQLSTLQYPPPQTYLLAGTYQVQTIATNSSGCKDTSTIKLQVNPSPILKTIPDTLLCKGNSITLNTTGASNYSWFPGTGLTCNNCASPVATPGNTIKYIVTGTNGFGCIGIDSVLLTVKLPFKIIVSPPDTLCIGRGIRINASGADSYIWTPQTGLSNTIIPNPLASPRQTTNYTVIGSDNVGCFKDTGTVKITVYPFPTVNAGKDTTIVIGNTVRLLPVISNDVTNVTWSPSSGIAGYQYPGITAKPLMTTEYTAEVSNIGKCKATDNVTVFVICNNMNVFIPNTFSPNGDGMNDIFYVRGSGIFRIRTLRIFNRWGEVVFESSNSFPNDPLSGWNGSYKGQKLSSDVFVYMADILCENNSILTYKGNVTLLK